MENLQDIGSVLSLLGIGGILGAFIKTMLDKQRELDLRINQIKEPKYRSMLVFMRIILNPENVSHFNIDDPNIGNLKESKEIIAYAKQKTREFYYNSFLYMSDSVVKSTKIFISRSTKANYFEVAKQMRQDLWNKKSKLSTKDVSLDD